MPDNIHPVVELLAARMETHPEEFGEHGNGRWAEWLDQLLPFATEEECVLLRGPMMQSVHEAVLDELLNGEQRRAEEKAAHDAEIQRMLAQKQSYQMQSYQMQSYQNALAGTLSQGLNVSSGDLRLGSETLNEGMLKKIKQALGI